MKRSSSGLLGALVAVVVLLGVVWTVFRASPRPEPAASAAPVESPAPSPTSTDLARSETGAERVAEEAPHVAEAAPAPAAAPARPPLHLRGRTLDVLGSAVPGVRVGTRGSDKVLATSDATGGLELDLPAGEHRLVAVDEQWVTVRYDFVFDADRERFLIVAPPIALAGRVVDDTGRPIEDAAIHVEIPLGAFVRFPLPLDFTGLESFETKSAADGSFELKRVPAVPRAELWTRSAGTTSDVRPLPPKSVSDLVIELKENAPERAFLEGVVVHEDGKPAVGAEVRLADAKSSVDAEGRFRLAIERVERSSTLVAVLKGFQSAVISDYGRVIESNDRHPAPVRLVLGPAALAIAGHVLGADGKPQSDWTVSLLDGAPLNGNQIPALTAEALTATDEQKLQTGDDGSFRLGGLRSIAYRLHAWSREGLVLRSEPIQAGSQDVVLRVEADAFVERITGRVVGRDGLPLADLDVSLQVVTARSGAGSSAQQVGHAKTGKDGAFEIPHVPRHLARMTVGGESIEFKTLELDDVDLSSRIEVVVSRMFRFRFEGEGGEGAPNWMAALDANGSQLGLVTLEAGMMMTETGAQLSEGSSHVLSVSEEAVRLVLHKDDKVLWSQPLHLVPGEITVVHRER